MKLRRRRREPDEVVATVVDSDVRLIPIDRDGESSGELADTTTTADEPDPATDGVDEVVLVELSRAFGDDPMAPVSATGDVDDSSDAVTAPTAARQTISIGGGDDLPDAVYLDEGLEVGDTSGTVFIDDDGADDAIEPQQAAVPGIDPRLRQRRIGVRRAEGRRRLKWVLVAAAVAIVVIGLLAALGSGLFAVRDVEVSGARYADADRVTAVVDDLTGTPTLLVDTAATERELEQIPWVADARVRTHFPNRATIELRERQPVATVRGPDQRFRVLDREGRVLDVLDGQPIAPALITTPMLIDLNPGDFSEVGYASAASLVTKLTPDVRGRLDSIAVTPNGSDMTIYLREIDAEVVAPGAAEATIEVHLGSALGDNEQNEKLVRLQLVLDDLAASDATIVDVSTEETTLR